MNREQVHDLMENELRCVQRGNYCDRDCAKCPLVKDDKELIEAYGYVIKALEQEPCDDAISRQAAIDTIMGQPPEPHYPSWYAAQIKKLPSAQSERKKGQWMKEDRGHVEYCAVCDQCGFDWIWSDREYFKFCPNCGAYMRGEQDG